MTGKIDLIMIDQDGFFPKHWIKPYVQLVLMFCAFSHIKVISVRMCKSQGGHGRHFYIHVTPAISASRANMLQRLFLDDPKRVSFNDARIRSGLTEFNKLFEAPRTRLRTVYKAELTSRRSVSKKPYRCESGII